MKPETSPQNNNQLGHAGRSKHYISQLETKTEDELNEMLRANKKVIDIGHGGAFHNTVIETIKTILEKRSSRPAPPTIH